jgi:hypothetical protein
MRTQCIKSVEDAQKALKAGAKLWSQMSCAEKKKYNRQSLKMRVKYEEALTNYRFQLKEFKQPPRPFAAFLKDYYYSGQFKACSDGEKGRDLISRLSKSASVAWHNLQPSQRLGYTRHFQAQYQEYKVRMGSKGEQLADLGKAQSSVPQTLTLPACSVFSSPEGRHLGQPGFGPKLSYASSPIPKPVSIIKSGRIGRSRGRTVKKYLRFSDENNSQD